MPAPPGGTSGFPVPGATRGPTDKRKNKHDADKPRTIRPRQRSEGSQERV